MRLVLPWPGRWVHEQTAWETGDVSRGDVVRQAFRRYHAREISLAELLRTIAQFRPR